MNPNVDFTQTTSCLEWCAGYGGISLGLKRAIPSLHTIAFGEIEAFACANLVAKMEAGLLDPAPIWTDLKTFPCEQFRDRVDILVAGYPCQPFSAAGKRLGTEDPRHLWPFIQRSISIIRPRLCFFENVEGHITLGLSTVISDLEELGYKVSWGIFSASEVGAPHQRKRVFILAYCQCEGLERFYNWNTSAERAEHVGADAWASRECGAWPSRPGELADSHSNEPSAQRGDDGEVRSLSQTQRQSEHGAAVSGGNCFDAPAVWPSRPGEQQFAWEPPRVVANGNGRGQRECCEQDSIEISLNQQTPQRNNSGGCNEAMGNAASERPGTLWAEPTGQQRQASIASASDAVGNASPTERWPDNLGRGEQAEQETGAFAASGQQQAQPPVGRDADGAAGWMDYAELCVSCDNRTDELRLLGNGVVPATAERAFRVLMDELLTADTQ